ncbi:MAG: ATP-binding protein [Tissierellia bacterium]|nr:ATP-binding protein [Tissierellia bacterium]
MQEEVYIVSFEEKDMKKNKKMILIPLVVAIASQFNISIMNSGFVVSAGIIVLISFLLYYENLRPIIMGFISGLLVYIFRLVLNLLSFGTIDDIVVLYLFEVLFYLFYTIIYSSLIQKIEKDSFNILFIVLVISDFTANLIEVSTRTAMGFSPSIWEVGHTLFIASLVRSAIIWLIYYVFKYYGFSLLRQEHQKRYKKLILLTSQLKTELYWIEKNMDHIEKVMKESYELYEKINGKEDRDTWSNRALSIASNVHEIKKENNLVIRGIQEITESEFKDKGIEYKDIVNILSETMEREGRRIGKSIKFDFHVNNNFFMNNHYFLISILRNLIMNSMDAIDNTRRDGKISLIDKIENANHIFIISDNGSGIDEESLNHIFSPGFSTKINYNTGEINRGLGLSIIQNIVVEKFHGNIKVESKIGQGTTFYIYIPKEILEE